MSLAEQIKNLTSVTHPGVGCKIGSILNELDSPDSKALAELLDNSRTSASAIARLLMENNHRVSVGTIGNHRRRVVGSGCRCSKPLGK